MKSKTTSSQFGTSSGTLRFPEILANAMPFAPSFHSRLTRLAFLATVILTLGMGNGKTDEDRSADLPAASRAMLDKLEELYAAELEAVEKKYLDWCQKMIPRLEEQLDEATKQKDLKGALAIDESIKELNARIESATEKAQGLVDSDQDPLKPTLPETDPSSDFQDLLNAEWSHPYFGPNSFVFTPDEKSGFKIHKGGKIPMKVTIEETDRKNEFFISTLAHSTRRDFIFKASRGELWTADANGNPAAECKSTPWKGDVTE